MQDPIILDTRKLLCPMPVIRLQQTLLTLKPGTIVTVLATDPGVLYDIPAWCRIHGHTLLRTEQTKQEIQIDVRVSAV